MKRLNNLYAKITSMDNLVLAEKKARKGKSHQYGVQVFDRDPAAALSAINEQLVNKSYSTSAYKTFTIYEPKERLISCLPYTDRIVHHAVMNELEKPFVDSFTADTYSCIKGRGIGGFRRNFMKALLDEPGTKYCLQIDIRKFYPSIDHGILKQQLSRKFKDQDLLWLLGGIIDSAPGIPIGNYLSQYFANFYLNGFDHWIKETMGVKYYFRYCDDIRILCSNKEELHQLLAAIKIYFQERLQLQVKPNHRIFPTALGVDVVGYVFFPHHTLLRKSIKQNFARAMATNYSMATVAAYWSWAKHADTKHLMKKLWQKPQLAA